MHRLFLDANVFLSAAYRKDAGVTRLWDLDVELCSSAYAVAEVQRNLESPEQLQRLDRFLAKVTLVTAVALPDALAESTELPDKDRPIIAGAVAAKATHMITGDLRHFGPFFGSDLHGARVLTPGQYLRNS